VDLALLKALVTAAGVTLDPSVTPKEPQSLAPEPSTTLAVLNAKPWEAVDSLAALLTELVTVTTPARAMTDSVTKIAAAALAPPTPPLDLLVVSPLTQRF